ncbi:MAG TPA: fimbria/pilus periplasmic chaperone [Burkholderiaceae bacterium]|nr:fimbria/pilus periplasmic chaperone [Burkholderiaceae bacterium]
MRALFRIALCLVLAHAAAAAASEIGVTPVVVHLDKAHDRATLSVVNSGAEPVIMQAEVIEWKRSNGAEEDAPSADMVINPSVFTVQPGQAQLVRVGLRRAAPAQREGTYRIVLREVPAAPRAGELRISGQVQVLMALRVPIYVAPHAVVRELRWQARREPDGSVTATLHNEGNVHARVGRMQLRSSEGVLASQAFPAVVFPGETQSFRWHGLGQIVAQPLTLEAATDHGAHSVPVALAGR